MSAQYRDGEPGWIDRQPILVKVAAYLAVSVMLLWMCKASLTPANIDAMNRSVQHENDCCSW